MNNLDKTLAEKIIKLHHVYTNMISRCYSPSNKNYKNYGGRGIYVCDEWKDDQFSFIEWAIFEGGYEIGLSNDRENNDGPYSPDNCRFTTAKVQNNNRRDNAYVKKSDGSIVPVRDFCQEMGITKEAYYQRRKNGLPIDMTRRPLNKKIIDSTGKDWTLKEMSEYFQIPYRTLQDRWRLHPEYTFEELTRSNETQSIHDPRCSIVKDEDGQILTLRQFANKYNIAVNCIRHRFYRGIRNPKHLKMPSDRTVRKPKLD